VLQAIGATVGPGAILALVFAAILAKRPPRVLLAVETEPDSRGNAHGDVPS
jgi:hypothetical protein